MKIGIIDADLIGREKHRFPNLACEKISGYWKSQGAEVQLLLDYLFPDDFDRIYISKVFTDTEVPPLPDDKRIHIGGTGFFFDKAPNLLPEIEHHMPDYHLYDEWIAGEVSRAEMDAVRNGKKFNKTAFMVQFKEYTDYSIASTMDKHKNSLKHFQQLVSILIRPDMSFHIVIGEASVGGSNLLVTTRHNDFSHAREISADFLHQLVFRRAVLRSSCGKLVVHNDGVGGKYDLVAVLTGLHFIALTHNIYLLSLLAGAYMDQATAAAFSAAARSTSFSSMKVSKSS